jgi:hypothetical protein
MDDDFIWTLINAYVVTFNYHVGVDDENVHCMQRRWQVYYHNQVYLTSNDDKTLS